MTAAKQMVLGLDTRKRDPVMHEHAVDFTQMELGHMVGDECLVLRCPSCMRRCIGQERARNWRFVHTGALQSTTRRAQLVAHDFCILEHDEIHRLTTQGAIIRNRQGQILEVKDRGAS